LIEKDQLIVLSMVADWQNTKVWLNDVEEPSKLIDCSCVFVLISSSLFLVIEVSADDLTPPEFIHLHVGGFVGNVSICSIVCVCEMN
jgi:hypothetical protein